MKKPSSRWAVWSNWRVRWETTLVFLALLIANISMFSVWSLGDYEVTFYKSAQYLLRGENIYASPYPHPSNGREYPPFNPIWTIPTIVPISVFPLRMAELLRYFLDLAAIPFLAYLCMRMVGLRDRWVFLLVAAAPWHFITLNSGQWNALVLLGTLLCYWGLRRANPSVTAIGLWLVLMKFQIALLVLLATVLFAWRSRILFKTISMLSGLIIIFSIPQPAWFYDLFVLYWERLKNPRLADSVLLLPGYPWAQIALLMVGVCFTSLYLIRTRATKPEPWLWALLVNVSLVGALHTFTYDWLMLSVPISWLLANRRWGILLIGILYLQPFVWTIVSLLSGIPVQFAFFTPGEFMMSASWVLLIPVFVRFVLNKQTILVLMVYVPLLLWAVVALVIGQPVPGPAMIPGTMLMTLVVAMTPASFVLSKDSEETALE